MFSKLGNRTLLLLAVGLLVVWGITKWNRSKDGGNTVRSSVVEIDTAALLSFSIHPKQLKHAELLFERSADGWTVRDSSGTHDADQEAVLNLLAGFTRVRTLRLAGTMEKDAVKYELGDTACTRIVFRQQEKQPVTFRAGLVDMAESEEGVTYVNMDGEPTIHAIAGGITRMLDRPKSVWRDHTLIGGDPAAWTRLTFTLPGAQGYVLQRDGTRWLLNGQPTNAERTQQFIDALSKGRNNRYADDANAAGLIPTHRLVILDHTATPTIVEIFDIGDKLVLRNSRKPKTLFALDRERDMQRFIRPAAFLLEVEPIPHGPH